MDNDNNSKNRVDAARYPGSKQIRRNGIDLELYQDTENGWERKTAD